VDCFSSVSPDKIRHLFIYVLPDDVITWAGASQAGWASTALEEAAAGRQASREMLYHHGPQMTDCRAFRTPNNFMHFSRGIEQICSSSPLKEKERPLQDFHILTIKS
jgi:hypothetical protein